MARVRVIGLAMGPSTSRRRPRGAGVVVTAPILP
jgi:hypothetical protein